MTRWALGVALVLIVLGGCVGAWTGGPAGLPIGLVAGFLIGVLLQAIPITALQIQRLHDFGWSATILVALLFIVVGSPQLLAAAIATRFAHLDAVEPWLFGCAFFGGAAYVGLGWFLLLVEAPRKENQFGPPPND